MYKVMIIDDESAIRKLLRLRIDWSEFNMEIAGEAESGIEAINSIDEIKPDICFVDIRMPFMDGIEFAKLAIKRYPKLKIVILTAYDDFSYARQCIGIGICEYQLKPIVKKDIHEILLGIKKELDLVLNDQPEQIELDNSNASINQIMEYIQTNYHMADLNLGKVAMEFGFNSSYLSRKFKSESGSSFVDYLSGIRMEKAKKLAKTGKPMYQTAMMVGVPDPNYFSKCFKKYVNVTYSEFALENQKS